MYILCPGCDGLVKTNHFLNPRDGFFYCSENCIRTSWRVDDAGGFWQYRKKKLTAKVEKWVPPVRVDTPIQPSMFPVDDSFNW